MHVFIIMVESSAGQRGVMRVMADEKSAVSAVDVSTRCGLRTWFQRHTVEMAEPLTVPLASVCVVMIEPRPNERSIFRVCVDRKGLPAQACIAAQRAGVHSFYEPHQVEVTQ